MFVVYVGSVLTTCCYGSHALRGQGEAPAWFIVDVALWLWFTVLFANFAEALAEGRGKAQADALRAMRAERSAKRLARPQPDGRAARWTPAAELRKGDVVIVEAGRPHSRPTAK